MILKETKKSADKTVYKEFWEQLNALKLNRIINNQLRIIKNH